MRAFLFPYQMLTDRRLYVAALHKNDQRAQADFHDWTNNRDPENIEYAAHKPLGIAWARHKTHFAGHRLAGIFDNILRQSRLRAHANMHLLGSFLLSSDDVPLWALGELNARLNLCKDHSSDLDHLEIGVHVSNLERLLAGAVKAGFSLDSPPRNAPMRHAFVATLRAQERDVPLRLIAWKSPPQNLIAIQGFDALQALNQTDALAFARSRRPSLLMRRDQIFFDIWLTRRQRQMPDNKHLIAKLPWPIRLDINRVLGD